MSQSISLPLSGKAQTELFLLKPVRLIHVSDNQEGIKRIRKGKSFMYLYKDKPITDEDELKRIQRMVIPPAWENVWICKAGNGHLQATGIDSKNRKQYLYHPTWNVLRNQTKFNRLHDFGKKLPKLRAQVQHDLAQKVLNEKKVLATVVTLMELTYIRIGNSEYEKLYQSYGLTTLKDKHVQIHKNIVKFAFTGKKGIKHTISIQNKKLARIVKECKEIPGKELFQYYDEQGNIHAIESGQVNDYIRQATNDEFTAKDFRTWAGSIHAIKAFSEFGEASTNTECKQNIIRMLDYVSAKLGNTRSVCKKYYVHPVIVKLYEERMLGIYLKKIKDHLSVQSGWSREEKALISILRKINI
jgi:DNA topoisomerase-1